MSHPGPWWQCVAVGVLSSALHLYLPYAGSTPTLVTAQMPSGIATCPQEAKPRLSPTGLTPSLTAKETEALERGGDCPRPHNEGGRQDEAGALCTSPPGPSALWSLLSSALLLSLLVFPPNQPIRVREESRSEHTLNQASWWQCAVPGAAPWGSGTVWQFLRRQNRVSCSVIL